VGFARRASELIVTTDNISLCTMITEAESRSKISAGRCPSKCPRGGRTQNLKRIHTGR